MAAEARIPVTVVKGEEVTRLKREIESTIVSSKNLNRSVEDNSIAITRTNQRIAAAGVGMAGYAQASSALAGESPLETNLAIRTPVRDITARWTLAGISGRGDRAWSDIWGTTKTAASDIKEILKSADPLTDKFTSLGRGLKGISADLAGVAARFAATWTAATVIEYAARRAYLALEQKGAAAEQEALQSTILGMPSSQISSLRDMSQRTGVSFDVYRSMIDRIGILQRQAGSESLIGQPTIEARSFQRAAERLGIGTDQSDPYQFLIAASSRFRSLNFQQRAQTAAEIFGREGAAIGYRVLASPLAYEHESQVIENAKGSDRFSSLPVGTAQIARFFNDPAKAIGSSNWYRRLSGLSFQSGDNPLLTYLFQNDQAFAGLKQWSEENISPESFISRQIDRETKRRERQAQYEYASSLNRQVEEGELAVSDVISRIPGIRANDIPSGMFPYGAKIPEAVKNELRLRNGELERKVEKPYPATPDQVALLLSRMLPGAAGNIMGATAMFSGGLNYFRGLFGGTEERWEPLAPPAWEPNKPKRWRIPVGDLRDVPTSQAIGGLGSSESALLQSDFLSLRRRRGGQQYVEIDQPIDYGFRQMLERGMVAPRSVGSFTVNGITYNPPGGTMPSMPTNGLQATYKPPQELIDFYQKWRGSAEDVNIQVRETQQRYGEMLGIFNALVEKNQSMSTLSKEQREIVEDMGKKLASLRTWLKELTEVRQPLANIREMEDQRTRPRVEYGGKSQAQVELGRIGLSGSALINYDYDLSVAGLRAAALENPGGLSIKELTDKLQKQIKERTDIRDKTIGQLDLMLQRQEVQIHAQDEAERMMIGATPADAVAALRGSVARQIRGFKDEAALQPGNAEAGREAKNRELAANLGLDRQILQIERRDRDARNQSEERLAQMRMQAQMQIIGLGHRTPGDQRALLEENARTEDRFAREEYYRAISAGQTPGDAFRAMRQQLMRVALVRDVLGPAQIQAQETDISRHFYQQAAGAAFGEAGLRIRMGATPGRERETAALENQLTAAQINFQVSQLGINRRAIDPYVNQIGNAQARMRDMQAEQQIRQQNEQRAINLMRLEDEHRQRMIMIATGPGGELDAANKIYQARISAIDKEKQLMGDLMRDQDVLLQKEQARLQHEQQVAQIARQQGERARGVAGGLYDTVVSQISGNSNAIRDFGRNLLVGTGRQVLMNWLQMRGFQGFPGLGGVFGRQYDETGAPTQAGKLFAGTVFEAPVRGGRVARDERLDEIAQAGVAAFAEEKGLRQQEIGVMQNLILSLDNLARMFGSQNMSPVSDAMRREYGMNSSQVNAIASSVVAKAEGMAEGGIVTKPTLAILGEKRKPEAVIPLDMPDAVLRATRTPIWLATMPPGTAGFTTHTNTEGGRFGPSQIWIDPNQDDSDIRQTMAHEGIHALFNPFARGVTTQAAAAAFGAKGRDELIGRLLGFTPSYLTEAKAWARESMAGARDAMSSEVLAFLGTGEYAPLGLSEEAGGQYRESIRRIAERDPYLRRPMRRLFGMTPGTYSSDESGDPVPDTRPIPIDRAITFDPRKYGLPGYAEGGEVQDPTIAALAEKGQPEAIVPISQVMRTQMPRNDRGLLRPWTGLVGVSNKASSGELSPEAYARVTRTPIYTYGGLKQLIVINGQLLYGPITGLTPTGENKTFLNTAAPMDSLGETIRHESTHAILWPVLDKLAADPTIAHMLPAISAGLGVAGAAYKKAPPGLVASEGLAYATRSHTYGPFKGTGVPGLSGSESVRFIQAAVSAMDEKGQKDLAAKYVRLLSGSPIKIPGYQTGGVVTKPTIAKVAEKEPEVIVPIRPEDVRLNLDEISRKYIGDIIRISPSVRQMLGRPTPERLAEMRKQTEQEKSRERTEALWRAEDARYGGHPLMDVGSDVAANAFGFTTRGSVMSAAALTLGGKGSAIATAFAVLPFVGRFRTVAPILRRLQQRRIGQSRLLGSEIDWGWAAQFDPRLAALENSPEGINAKMIDIQAKRLGRQRLEHTAFPGLFKNTSPTDPAEMDWRMFERSIDWYRASYPNIGRLPESATLDRFRAAGTGGFDQFTNRITIGPHGSLVDMVNTIAHEHAHAIQKVRWPEMLQDYQSNFILKPGTDAEKRDALRRFIAYWDQPAEVQARALGRVSMQAYQRQQGILRAIEYLHPGRPLAAGTASNLARRLQPTADSAALAEGADLFTARQFLGWEADPEVLRILGTMPKHAAAGGAPRFAFGGEVFSEKTVEIGEGGSPEAVIPISRVLSAAGMPQLYPQIVAAVREVLRQQQAEQQNARQQQDARSKQGYGSMVESQWSGPGSIERLLRNAAGSQDLASYSRAALQATLSAQRGDVFGPIQLLASILQGRDQRQAFASATPVRGVPPGQQDLWRDYISNPGVIYSNPNLYNSQNIYNPPFGGMTPFGAPNEVIPVPTQATESRRRSGISGILDILGRLTVTPSPLQRTWNAARPGEIVPGWGPKIPGMEPTSPVTGQPMGMQPLTVGQGLGIGATAAASIFGAVQGIQQGGFRGGVTAVGSLASGFAAIAPMLGIAGGPIGAAIGAAAGIVAAMMPDRRKERREDMQAWMRDSMYQGHPEIGLALGMGGREILYNWKGGVSSYDREAIQLVTHRPTDEEPWYYSQWVPKQGSASTETAAPPPIAPVAPTPGVNITGPTGPNFTFHVNAFDVRSMVDRAGDFASLVQHALRGSHPLVGDIRRLSRS